MLFKMKIIIALTILALVVDYAHGQTSCTPSPCLNNGVCMQTSTTSIYCWCPANYYGPYCQYVNNGAVGSVVTCANSPCLNGGLCLQLTTPVSSCQYTCICLSGYTGSNCQTYVPATTSCSVNNGNCAAGSACTIDVTTFAVRCICPPNYTGTYCDQLLNSCYSSNGQPVCKNSGVCTPISTSPYYQCSCPVGYSGYNCELFYCYDQGAICSLYKSSNYCFANHLINNIPLKTFCPVSCGVCGGTCVDYFTQCPSMSSYCSVLQALPSNPCPLTCGNCQISG